MTGFRVLIFLLVGLLLGCNQKVVQQESTPGNFVSALKTADFFKYKSASQACTTKITKDPNAIWACESGRLFHADAEGLAEGFALTFFVEEIGPFLSTQGVNVKGATWGTEGTQSSIVVGTTPYTILKDPMSENAWVEASNGTIAMINDLLKATKSTERAFGLYGGEDLHIVILTPELFELIEQEQGMKTTERPWVKAY